MTIPAKTQHSKTAADHHRTFHHLPRISTPEPPPEPTKPRTRAGVRGDLECHRARISKIYERSVGARRRFFGAVIIRTAVDARALDEERLEFLKEKLELGSCRVFWTDEVL